MIAMALITLLFAVATVLLLVLLTLLVFETLERLRHRSIATEERGIKNQENPPVQERLVQIKEIEELEVEKETRDSSIITDNSIDLEKFWKRSKIS